MNLVSYAYLGYKWGNTQIGTSGGQVSWSFAETAGQFFQFDFTIDEVEFQALIRDAFDVWERVANIDFVEVADSWTVDIRLGWEDIDGEGSTLAEATGEYIPGPGFDRMSQAEIRFDSLESWSLSKTNVNFVTNFYTTAVHEIGHAIGLAHTDDASTIMYPFTNPVVELAPGDIQGIVGLYGRALGLGTAGPDNWNGTQGNDVYNGLAGNDTILALAGNDELTGGQGNDYIDGGNGLDTAVFSGPLVDYGVSFGPGSTIYVQDRFAGTASDGRDTLFNVERISFTDGSLAFDIDGNAGQAYRLYQAAFDRVPDLSGLGFWIDQRDAGMNLLTIANNFIGSPEFRGLYGTNPSNATFVDLLYQNVMNRNPDAGGFDYWTGRMAGGLSRAEVLAHFSESAENKANVLPAIDDGIWYT